MLGFLSMILALLSSGREILGLRVSGLRIGRASGLGAWT